MELAIVEKRIGFLQMAYVFHWISVMWDSKTAVVSKEGMSFIQTTKMENETSSFPISSSNARAMSWHCHRLASKR